MRNDLSQASQRSSEDSGVKYQQGSIFPKHSVSANHLGGRRRVAEIILNKQHLKDSKKLEQNGLIQSNASREPRVEHCDDYLSQCQSEFSSIDSRLGSSLSIIASSISSIISVDAHSSGRSLNQIDLDDFEDIDKRSYLEKEPKLKYPLQDQVLKNYSYPVIYQKLKKSFEQVRQQEAKEREREQSECFQSIRTQIQIEHNLIDEVQTAQTIIPINKQYLQPEFIQRQRKL